MNNKEKTRIVMFFVTCILCVLSLVFSAISIFKNHKITPKTITLGNETFTCGDNLNTQREVELYCDGMVKGYLKKDNTAGIIKTKVGDINTNW